jgi:hypothetical protein
MFSDFIQRKDPRMSCGNISVWSLVHNPSEHMHHHQTYNAISHIPQKRKGHTVRYEGNVQMV